MPFKRTFLSWSILSLVVTGICLTLSLQRVLAGSVVLKNGIQIEGKSVPIEGLTKKIVEQNAGPVKSHPILSIDTGMKRYFVPSRQVKSIDPSAILSKYVRFKVPQRRRGKKTTISSLGPFTHLTEFDKFGRRTVTVPTKRGKVSIVQGVTIIDPRYLTITGITHVWEHGLATTSIPPDNLDLMIRQVTDQEKPSDRMLIARFYFQAGLYEQAEKELLSIAIDFPELKKQIEEIDLELREQQNQRLILELKRRARAGQHQLIESATKLFPESRMSAGVLRKVRELKKEYAVKKEKIENAKSLLGELQSKLKEKKLKDAVVPLRSEVMSELNFESLARLQSFLNFATDDKLEVDEKLAFAYSGWVLGSDKAIPNLSKAIRLWQARFLMIDYLHAISPKKRTEILLQLKKLEGIDPQTIINLIPLLPPTLETSGIQGGVAKEITVPETALRPEVKYRVLLPQEYSPFHTYPMVVALRPAERSTRSELRWWGGTQKTPLQSQRRGYIVIAPEYLKKKQATYKYSAAEHKIVLAAIRDAKQRFMVDSDHVFLSGHGVGGDAAIDIGMSHPSLFAGIIPICGIMRYYSKYYWRNTKHVSWYIIGGELDRNSLDQNAREMNRMMRYGYDVIYCEYVGRGYESYYAEIHKIFDWMELQKRGKQPKEIKASILRPGDNRFYWIKAEGLPRRTLQSDVLAVGRKRAISSMRFEARITLGNSIYLHTGAKRNTLWLNRSLVDFEKRLTIKRKGRIRFRDFPEENTKTILEDFELRVDRQNIYSMKIILN
ncbi:hypothetical protein MNBD_PLANCTO02-2326 [hydrothermal vent metagenome]|uniref:Peptidase n=1 Tax=hydrothermal vent metagenome TaxID=652676 RepID=A0A3B1DGW7_9ZZZZ